MQDVKIETKGHEIINLIFKFELQQLDSEWIDFIVNSDFSEIIDFSIHFLDFHQSTNFTGLFNAINGELREYVDLISLDNTEIESRKSLTFLSTSSIYDDEAEKTNAFTKFWIDITKHFSLKSLLAFLYYFIHKGQIYNCNENDRELSLLASSSYFLLLSVPGSNAFRVFHPTVYSKAQDVLKLTIKLNIAATCLSKSSQKTSRQSSLDDEMGNVAEEFVEQSFLDVKEAKKLVRLLNILLNDFMRFLNTFSLKQYPDILEESASVLVQVTRCEIQNSKDVFVQRHSANSLSSLCYNSYVAIQALCSPLHGSVNKNVTIVLKELLMSILMTFCGSSEYSMRALGVIREHSVIFVKYLMYQIKEGSYEGVFVLIQHLCVRVPDRADYREKISKAVVEILLIFPVQTYCKFMKWFFQFSHNEKASHRLFSLEVISRLLDEKERNVEALQDLEKSSQSSDISSDNEELCMEAVEVDHNVSIPENRKLYSHKFLLCIIFSRCRDAAATVRSKALNLLALSTLSDNPTITEQMQQIFLDKEPIVYTTPHLTNANINCESPAEFVSDMKLPNIDMMMTMLSKRASDNKVTVRKSALQVMENILKMNQGMVQEAHLKILMEHCRDPALLIRKQMVTSLTSLVQIYPNCVAAIKVWVKGVLPLSIDPEAKVQEKVVEFVDLLICRRIRYYQENTSVSEEDVLPWRILDFISAFSYHKFFTKVLQMWSKSDLYVPKLMEKVNSHIDGPYDKQVWSFLAVISQFVPINRPGIVLNYFRRHFINESQVKKSTLSHVLAVLCNCTKYIDEEELLSLQRTLKDSLSSFSVDVQLISPMANFLTLVSYHLAEDEESGVKAVEEWAAPILKSCDDFLKQILFPKKPTPVTESTEEEIFRYLYTLGDISQLCPSKVNKRMFLMLQSLIFHQKHTRTDMTLRIPSTQTQSSQPLAISFTPTSKIQNLSVITLAKMCLQHEDQAKRIIPALGKMLETTTLGSMKINIVIALSDMCVRYATLVDPLMPQVTACLRDTDLLVRKTTLTLLIGLLQEDYLKLKDSFFYRILQCLCDDEEEIRNTVNFYMTERLLKRSSKIFLHHFVECIFHYNCYEEHESYNRFRQNEQEKELFSLSGAKNRDRRMMLYRFMLDHMHDDQRFATTQRLCQDVLGGVVDGRIKLTPSSLPMLEDTLMVLSSEEIKLAWLRYGPDDANQPPSTDEQAEMAGIAIKKTLISQVVKRNVIENIVPILISLKHKLEESRSPLMKQLLLYFKEIMKDYKNEVKEILASDKLIAKEIEFDLRRLEEEERQEAIQTEKGKRKENLSKGSLGNSPKFAKTALPKKSKQVDEAKTDEELDDQPTSSEQPDDQPTTFEQPDQLNKTDDPKEVENEEPASIPGLSTPPSNLRKVCAPNKNKSTLRKDVMIKLHKVSIQNQNSPLQSKSKTVEAELFAVPITNPRVPATRPSQNEPKYSTPPKAKQVSDPLKMKENLMRAISTPNASKNVIRNITFIDETQNISQISVDDASTISGGDEASKTLLLHFNSPEAFAKDDQFDRVRKSSDNQVKMNPPTKDPVPTRRSPRRRKEKEATKDKMIRDGFMRSRLSDNETTTQEDSLDD